ncbi:MAG: hypothetical protein WBD45_20555 [Terriglobales bacterium]
MPLSPKLCLFEIGSAKVAVESTIPFNQPFGLRLPLCALIVFAVSAFGMTTSLLAQVTSIAQTQSGASSSSQPPADQTSAPVSPPKPVAIYNLLERKSIVFPNIATSTERLSVGQKFELSIDNTVSVNSITWDMLGSAVSQADDSPTGFGQGWDAYGKRFGAGMARTASSEFFGTFLLASALHQDPRFYAEINPRLGHAIKYSVQHVFIMRNDDGHDGIAWSELGGPLMAEALANVYWPDRNRTVGDTLLRYGLDLASRAGGNMLREYWPVVVKRMSHSSASGHN